MSSIATTEAPTAVAELINPLTLDVSLSRLDAAVDTFIDSAVGAAENEMRRMMRRREVAASVRGVLKTRQYLESLVGDPAGVPDLTRMVVNGERAGLIEQFKVINPSADDSAVAGVVDGLLAGFLDRLGGEEPKKRGKK